MVRKANAAFDAGKSAKTMSRHCWRALEKFDEIFGVLKDDDQSKMKAILEWAERRAARKTSARSCSKLPGQSQLSDDQINEKIAEMEAARKSRNFKVIGRAARRTDERGNCRGEYEGWSPLEEKIANL